MKLFLFNNDEKLIGTVSPLEGIQNEEINKIQTIECTTVYSELIEKASYIGHKDYSDNRIFHLYKIDHVTKTSTTDVKIVGVHTFFDDMESDGYVKDFRPTNRELVGVLTTILDGSRWQLGTVNIQRRYTGNFYYVTRKEALSKLIEATQIEIKPRLEFSRGKITGRYLDVFTRLGGRNGKVFVHGRDLLTVSEKKSQGAIYTAVVGRGKGEETDTGGYGRRISFKDVEWRRTSGQPVDKPVGQEYVEIPAMTKLYGFEKGTKPRIKIVEFQDETDKEKLLRLSYEWLEKNSRMQVEYSAKVLNVGNLELGDTVGIFNPKLGIKYETRVFKVKRNLVNNKLTEFGIGDKVNTSPFSRTIELAKEMKNFQDDTVYWLEKIRERLSDKLINEDGYNYDLKADNEYKVPAGYYSFDKPIDQNPTKVVYMGAGKIAIANSKKPTGEWNWKTFLDGTGATLDLINTGVLRAGRIQSADGRSYWDLDTGEFHMEQSAINEAVKTVVNGKVQEIVGEVKKNLPTKEELKGKSSYLHKKYSDYADGRNMSDNSTLKYIGIYTGDKQEAPTNASEYSWTKIKSDGKLYKAYSNSLNGLDFTLVEPDENAKLFAKNRPRVNIVNDNDISDIWQANMFLSFKPNTKYTLTARAKGNSNKLWAYFRNNKTSEQYSWGQLEFRGLETKSITFTTTNDVDDVLFKFVLVPEDEDWTGIQIDWFTIYEGDKRYTDYPVNEPAQYHKYRYFGYVFKEGIPVASDFEWFDLQQTSITNDKYTHIVYSDNADGSNFGREPKKYMGVTRTTSPTQPTDKTAYKWFKVKGEDGVSNYIHRKYSDYSNGASMSDNSNLKYIGIYTGTSPTPPTTASSYLWSKIKGEDGANGVPGAKGADGRTPYFHTAYSNSATGDRDFSTTNSTGKEYIGTYSDFEVADSTDYRKYKWVKIKGEDGRDGDVGLNLLKGTKEFITSYFAPPDAFQRDLVWVDETERYEDFAVKSTIYQYNGLWQNVELEKGKTYEYGFYAKGSRNTNRIYFNPAWASSSAKQPLVQTSTGNITFDLTTEWKFYSFRFTVTGAGWSQCRVEKNEDNNGIKLSICGMYLKEVKNNQQTPLKWSPSIEDLQGHSLTANLRFEGKYINSITTDVKAYLDVFYDGQKITSGFNAQVKYKGGNRTDWSGFWTANVDNTGRITNLDWGNREQNGTPLEVIVLVTYKDSNTVANARMENIPDVVEIKEITKKYKTFESTIDQFNSTIGEVKQQVLANEEKRNLIIGSRLLNDSDYKVFGKAITAEDLQGVTAKIYQSTKGVVSELYNGNPYLYVIAMNNTKPSWQGVGFKLSTNYMQYGSKYSLRIPCLIIREATPDKGIYMEIKNHNTGKIIWTYRLDKIIYPAGERDAYPGIWIERTATFQLERAEVLSDYSLWIYAVQNGGFCISAPYMCEGDVLPKNYSPAPEDVHLQNSRIESSIKQTKSDIELKVSEVSSNNSRLESIIKQTKDKIDLKVSKDEIISAINLSVERDENGQYGGLVKIDADKVDIRGVLRAYTGEIGGFRIGANPNDNRGFWLTGKDNFNCGINPGHNAGTRGAQIWAAWGNNWSRAGSNAWWVDGNGVMVCNNRAVFNRGFDVHGAGIYTHDQDITSQGAGNSTTNVIWWSQINRVKSAISDIRLKTNIKPTKINALDTLNNVEMVEFNWKKDGKFEKIGAIAQQVQSVDKDLVVHDMDDKQTYNDYLRINYYDTIPYLIKAIQELSTENQQLKSQIKEMNDRLNKLEDKINGNL
jgi:phage minor structural protein, N-terminal domain protein|nr:MAG TPA: tail protein [Caudoviricetes sp.]